MLFSFRSWLRQAFGRSRRSPHRAGRGRKRGAPAPLSLEGLEDRSLPSVLVATPGKDGSPAAPLGGVVNTYYPGTGNVGAGATAINLGASRGSATTITTGDLLLVIQIQNASINSSNNATYGDGSGSGAGSTGGTAGTFEYVVAAGNLGAAGGTLAVTGTGAGGGLLHSYFEAASTAAHGQETFEVVRVPQYLNASLGSTLTAAPWNGSTGGILALDVAGNLNLNAATVSVNGEGFRGGAGLGFTGGTGKATDYALASTANDDGSKGEGTAGTPEWVYDATTNTNINTGQAFDGLPGGSMARGAPGNAGGGGTDADPSANDQNTGGGGGGNGGAGGQGGYSWATALNLGGLGGAAYAPSFSQLTLGGGGGAGARNNSTGTASAGGTGGGLVLVRAGSVSGTGTITANGIMGVTPQNDGGPGGGAGGSVEFLVNSGSLAGLSIQAKGANGTDAYPTGAHSSTPPPSSASNYHGPGGGGGGGVVAISGPAGSIDVGGGGHGTTTVDKNIYGAVVGNPGVILMPLSDSQVPGAGGGFEGTADVSVVASAPASALPGGTISYTLTVHNAGPADAKSVSLSDAVPAGTTFVSATQTGGASSFTLTKPPVGGTGTLTGTDALLAAGDTATFVVVVQVNAGATTGTVIPDTANVSTTSVDPYQANNSSTVQTTVGPAADLSVTNSAPAIVSANGTVTYTITVSNNGPNAAQNVSLSDLLPAGTTFLSQTQTSGPAFTLSNSGNQLSDTLASLPAGQSATFQVQAQVTAAAGSNLSDTAQVSSPTLDLNSANNSATATTAVQPSADVAVSVSAPATVNAGNTVTYTITVSNNGPNAAQGISLSDLLPAGTTFVSQSQTSGPAFTLTNSGNQLSDSIASLASGQSATLQVVAQTKSSLANNSSLSDTATVSTQTTDPVSGNNSSSASTTVNTSADLAVAKFAPAQVLPGTRYTYQFTVFNQGPSDAQTVTVTDTLPAGTTFVSQSQTDGPAFTLSNSGSTITNTLATLPAGQSATFQVVVSLSASATSGTVIGNTVNASSATTDPNPNNNPGSVGSRVGASPGLAISNVVSNPTPNVGGTITYTVTLTNLGAAASNVTVSDPLPTWLTNVTTSPSAGAYANGVWTIPSLAANGTVTLTITGKVSDPNPHGSTATVTGSSQPFANPDQATAVETPQQADLGITNVVSKTTPNVGDPVTYTVTLTNAGSDTATNVTVGDAVPTWLSGVTTGTSAGSFANGVWTIPSLAKGASVTLTFSGTVSDPSAHTSTATVTHSDQYDPTTPVTASATETPQQADLTVSNVVSNPTPNVGDTVTYTVTLTNAGPNAATNVTLSDAVPAGLSNVTTAPGAGTSYANGVWTVPGLAKGGTVTLTFTGTVSDPSAHTSTATVTHSDQFDPTTPDTASATETPQQADLTITNVVNKTTPNVGDVVTYTVTLSNAGPNAATNVTVGDAVPAWLSGVTTTPAPGTSFSNGVWTVPSLAKNGSVTLTFTGTVSDPNAQTSTATVTHSDQYDPTTPVTASATETPQQADLTVTNAVSNPTPNVGDVVTYTVTLSNAGPNTATNVTLSDAVPTWLSGVTTGTSTGSFANGVWTIPSLAKNGSATLTFTGTVSDPSAHTSTATVTHSDQYDPTTPATASATETPQQADLGITNVVSNPTPNVGNAVTYTVTLTNAGPNTATNVTVGDAVPTWLSGVTTGTSAGSFANGVWTVPSLANGASATLTFSGTLTDPNAHTSTATVTHSDQYDPTTPVTASATETPQQADLGITNVVSNPTPNVGDPVTYTVTLTNAGPNAATNVTVGDAVPAWLSGFTATPAPGTSFANGVWTVPNLAKNGSVTLTFSGTVSDPSSHTSTATVTHSDQYDPTTPVTASATETPQQADLTVTNAVSNNAPYTGHTITYTVTLSNAGPNAASNVTVSDPLPTWLTNVTVTPSAGSYANGVWSLAGLALNGTATLTFTGTVADASTHTSTATVTHSDQYDPTTPNTASVSETSQLDVITANNQSVSTNEGTALPGSVTAAGNDGDPLTYAAVAGPAHGTLTLNPNGKFTYTPAANYHGPDSFTFNATDGTTTSNTATVSINVIDTTTPVANGQSLVTGQNDPLPVTLTASDSDNDPLTYAIVPGSGPAHGTLTFNGNGSYTYTPAPGYVGPDSFSFTASDGTNTSAPATISLDVVTPTPPVADNQSVSTNENVALPVTLTGSDSNGAPLTYAIATNPAHGTLTFNANGSYTYTPALNYHGPDSFTFTDNDGIHNSNPATVSISVLDNSTPAANGQSLNTGENTALPVTLTATDSDGDPLTYAIVPGSGPAHGTLTFNGNGSYTYTPAPGYVGPDSFSFTASDGTNTSAPATVSINVSAIVPPVADNQSVSTNENTALPVTLTGSDSNGAPLTYAIATNPAHGTLTFNSNGHYTYTPANYYHGPDSFTFTDNDGVSTSSPATVSITVRDTVPPTANNQSVSTNENTPLPVTLTASDPDGDPLTYSVTGGPAHGTLTRNGNGTYTYTPSNNYHGPDSFTFTASDGTNTSNTATVSINVVDNVPPTANNQSVSTNENTPLPVTLTGSDPEGDPLTYAIASGPSHGTLTRTGNGSYTYTPANNYHGPDSFTFTDNDGSNNSSPATVSITVADSTPPVANGQSLTTAENVSLPVTLSGTDADGDPLTYALVPGSGPAHGSLVPNGSGGYTYVPAPGHHGPDSFRFTASDGTNTSAPAAVNIRVDAPPATADSGFTTPAATPRTFGPADFPFSDPDAGDGLKGVVITSLPGQGTLTYNGQPVQVGQFVPVASLGSLVYTPAPNPGGPVQTSFGFAVSDGYLTSPPATMTVNVLAPSAPTITPISDVVLNGCTYFPINLTDSFTAANPGPFTATVNYGDGGGVQPLTLGANNSFSLAHVYATRGTYEVDVTVTDGRGLTGTTSFFVGAHFALPQAYPQLFTINDGSAQRSMVTSITLTFAQHEVLDAGAVTLATAGGKSVGVRTLTRDINGKTVVLVQFSDPSVVGNSLADGRYVLALNGSKVHDSTGAAYAGGTTVTDNFFRLFGDSNGDAKVDATDLKAFQAALRSMDGTAPYRWYFDYDQNCTVDAADYNQFLARYGHSI